MKASKKDLKTIEIEQVNGGFVVWMTEEKTVKGKKHMVRHWVLDGSCILEDGEIQIGNKKTWKLNAKYKKYRNVIIISRDK